MKSLFWTVLFLWSLIVPIETKGGPQVGGRPPLLKATKLLQAPRDAKLDAESLKGKVTVLEFWATWCGPCVLATPRLNELAEKFKDQPVQFVAITSEDEATVKTFLAKKPINAWVALDIDNAMKAAYEVDAIPHTVVLARDGSIAAITFPSAVTEPFINDLLAGKGTPLKTNGEGLGPGFRRVGEAGPNAVDKREAAPLFEVSVRPSAVLQGKTYSGGGGNLRYRGFTVLELLPEAFEGASSARVWTNAPMPEGKYDVTIIQSRGHTAEEAHELLWQALQSTFALTATKTTNEVDVLVLRKGKTGGPGLTPTATKGRAYQTGPGRIEAANASLEWLAWVLEDKLNKPVIDETGLTNRYDILLKWDEKIGGPDLNGSYTKMANPEELIKAVREQLGLELVPVRRPVAGFEVRKLEKAKQSVKRE